MLLFPNAKINIGLYITEKRPDGFHNLESVFVPVDWTDVLEITPSTEFEFITSGIPVPGNAENNLCVKAYHLLKQSYVIPNVTIQLHKVIPMGAGLGGGSADATFTLIGLRDLFELPLNNQDLVPFAKQLGSDCAFFLSNSPQFGTGKGDELETIPCDLKGLFGLLVFPKVSVSTQEAYAGVRPEKAPNYLPDVISKPISDWKDLISNDFEKNIFPVYPVLKQIKETLYEKGATYAAMSGSGSTLYGIFTEKPDTNLFDKEGYITKLVAF